MQNRRTNTLHITQIGAFFFLAAGNPVFGADQEAINSQLAESSSLFWALCKVMGSLSIVIGLMILLIHFIKKSGITQGVSTPGSLIKVIETKMVAPKKYITIVDIAGKYVALGVTDHNINTLTNLDDTIRDQLDQQPDNKSVTPFAKILRNVKTSMKGKVDSGAGDAD